MTLTLSEKTQETLQLLSDSVWIFSAFTIMAESGGFAALKNRIEIPDLAKITAIPSGILEQMLKIFHKTGFVIQHGPSYELSSDFFAVIETQGMDKIIAQQQVTFGKINDLILTARAKRMQVGWQFEDDIILQAQGQLSELVATDFIPPGSDVQKALMAPEAIFLDVGAGVAKITLKLCEIYPQLRCVALEPANKPHQLAQKNITHSSYSNRIELRKIGVEALQDIHLFDVVWIAQGFIPAKALIAGLPAVKKAMKKGAILLTYAIANDKENLANCVKNFSASLYGEVRTVIDMTKILQDAGFAEVKIISDVIPGYKVMTAVK